MDFEIDIKHDGEIKILQITDMQVIDASQQRYEGRLPNDQPIRWAENTKDKNLYCYIRELIERTTPDMIIITGDITYGEFDDSGKSQCEFIKFMDSFEIPWAPIYGNHDNETYKGIPWQNEQYINSKFAIFKKGNVFGNGNYSIAVKQNGVLQRVICMTDSNGCGKLGVEQGLRDDQLGWIKSTAAESDAPLFICMHIPCRDFFDAYLKLGYVKKEDTREDYAQFELSKDIPAKDGDFGRKFEHLLFAESNRSPHLPVFKECRVDGVFAGHCHKINTSVLCDGIRYTFGLKTGLYDYHDPEAMGGTLITLNGRSFTVKHEYCKIKEN